MLLRRLTFIVSHLVQLLKQITVAMLFSSGFGSALADLPAPHCQKNLDVAVSLYNSGDNSAAEIKLNQLKEHCAHWPQVHHNLGVLAAQQQQWESAAAYFEQAIQASPITAHSLNHLRSVYQHQATQAFQTVLGHKNAGNAPELRMQNSASHALTEQTASKNQTELHDIVTVEYELYDWWQSAASKQTEAWLSHYAFGYPPMENNDAARVEWQQVERDITFTQNDAVVVLQYEVKAEKKLNMLFMRVQNNRWKIYRETQF